MLERNIYSSKKRLILGNHIEECLLVVRRYSVYVLESSTSRRLTYFVPPLVCQKSHLIVLVCLLTILDNMLMNALECHSPALHAASKIVHSNGNHATYPDPCPKNYPCPICCSDLGIRIESAVHLKPRAFPTSIHYTVHTSTSPFS